MDVEMGDVAYDIDIDVGAVATSAPSQQQSEPTTQSDSVPAAYFEDLQPQKAWPEYLNLQGVSDFDPNDPLYYAMEVLGTEPRVKQLRWVNDSSVNLEFYSADDAALALTALTHADANAGALAAQTARPAKPYSKKPDSALVIREANAGDQKPKGAANRSNYYQRNPDVRGNTQREPRRRQPKRDLLDYGDEEPRNRRRRSGDESMAEDSGVERRRNNYPRNDRNDRNNRNDRNARGRDGRDRRPRDSGRLNADIDSYRPGGEGSKESRHGRLRGRSASPASNDEGDGRFGFAEDTSNVRTRYRSRSRSPHPPRRRRSPSPDRWTHDRANYSDRTDARWQKDAFVDTSPMGNHRRSDAGSGGSLLSRMTKDGRPINSLAARMTRDDSDDDAPRLRSLASRITRGGDDGYGRLKGDDSIPRDYEFEEPKPRRGLAERISGETEGIHIRGAGAGGINIRGVAGGA